MADTYTVKVSLQRVSTFKISTVVTASPKIEVYRTGAANSVGGINIAALPTAY